MADYHEALYTNLKKQTTDLHVEAHSIPYIKNLLQKNIPLESYIGHLRCLSVVYGALEHQLDKWSKSEMRSFTQKYIPKLESLREDLKTLNADTVQDIIPAVRNAQATADKILLYSKKNPYKLLSYIYVLDGSLNGGKIIKEHLSEIFDIQDNRGVRYFSLLTKPQREFWEDFTRKLDQNIKEPSHKQAVLDSATEAFYDLMKIFEKLFPVHEKALGKHIVSLNPEAGNHPIPDSPEELEAAQKAAHLCFNEFPYLSERYGKRGLRFTVSDAAWLTTLADESPETAKNQIKWITAFLASKGIPSYVTERQLILLAETLSHFNPAGIKKYYIFADVAKKMKEERSLYISNSDFEEANQLSDRLINEMPNSNNRLKLIIGNLGKILASALVDQIIFKLPTNEVWIWLAGKENFSEQETAQIQKIINALEKSIKQ